MGITTALVAEDGIKLEVVEDPHNVLQRVLPDLDDASSDFLRYIDPYGNTVFNYLQAPQLLAEWDALSVKTADTEDRRVVDDIRKLIQRLQDERHIYLKFIGD